MSQNPLIVNVRGAMSVYVENHPEETMWFFTLFIGVNDSKPSEDMSHNNLSVISVSTIIYKGLIHIQTLKPTVL